MFSILTIRTGKRIYLSSPHLTGREQVFIKKALDSNWVAPLGPNVDAFEKEVAEKVGVAAAVAVSSGTAAIHLALILLGIQKGDTVFCSSLTFVASANPILYQQATPVFIDCDKETWNMSPLALYKALKEAADLGDLPKAVIVVNLYGQSAKMDEILKICNYFGVPVVEDAAESLGSLYKNKASGTLGKYGIYSFNGNKIITTSGGGMIVSDDTEALEKARMIAAQARDPFPYYHHSMMGFNYRMSNLLAGVGLAQIEVLEERVKSRRNHFSRYYTALSGIPGFYFMPELEETSSNRWLTALTINEQEAGVSSQTLLKALTIENIEARHVWKPLHLQPLFKGVGYYTHGDESVSESLFNNGICLPSGSNMSLDDQNRIIDCIHRAIKVEV